MPDSRLEMSLETSLTVTLKSGIVDGIREANSGSGWLELYSVEFVAKFLAKSLALSEEEEITSGPLMIVGIGDLPRLRTLLVILQNSQGADPRSLLGWIPHSLIWHSEALCGIRYVRYGSQLMFFALLF